MSILFYILGGVVLFIVFLALIAPKRYHVSEVSKLQT